MMQKEGCSECVGPNSGVLMMMRMMIQTSENDEDGDDAERRGVPSVLDPTPGGSVSNFPLSQKVS